jgi:hypothetical protein
MKLSAILFTLAGLIYALEGQSQVRMILSTGIAPQQTPVTHYIFVNRSSPRDEFTFDLSQVKASYFVGVGARYDVRPFFFSAEAQYNRREYTYNIAYTFPGFGRTEEAVRYSEYMNVINLPVSLGVDLGAVDVMSGFLPQLIVSHQSDMESIYGYSENLKTLRFGWHTGIAANIADMRIGLSYQMDFNNYADHINIHDQNLILHGRSSRLLGTLSYLF